MWSRERSRSTGPGGVDEAIAPAVPEPRPTTAGPAAVAKLGRTVYVKGELIASEDLVIDGHVEGRIDLSDHTLTIEPNAVIEADIVAKAIVAFGSVVGGVTARETLEIRRSGSIVGEVACARLAIQDGAHFQGKVEMPTPQ